MEGESDEESLYTFDSLEELITGRRHPLIEAAREGNYDRLTLLIRKLSERELPLTIRDQSGWQAIHFAAKLSDTKCLSSLLCANSSLIHSVTREKVSPLMVAAGEGNLNAVNVLLPLLSNEQVFSEDLHGLNALYYAVAVNSSNGNLIVHRLLERFNPSCMHPLVCSSSFDALPVKVAQTKNFGILKALLDAGLDPAYRWIPGKESATIYVNGSLVNNCVSNEWVAGLELVIKAQLKKHGGNIHSLWELFTTGEYPALEMIFSHGDLECLQLLIDNGIQVPCHNMPSSATELDTCRFLDSVVRGDFWKKQEFLRFFLVEESCSQFQQHIEVDLLSLIDGQDNNYVVSADDYQTIIEKMGGSHPLDAVLDVISECSDEHSIGDFVQLLLDCNFTFDFRFPVIETDGISWNVCIDHLFTARDYIDKGYNRILASELMKRQNRLSITMESIFMAYEEDRCRERVQYPHEIRYLPATMKYLAARPIPKLVETLGHISVTGFDVVCYKVLQEGADAEERKLHRVCHSLDETHWRFTAFLLLKGIQTQPSRCKDSFTKPVVPFSVLFLRDNERRSYLNERKDHCIDTFELELKMQMVSSLQSLCRTVIRNAMGAVRLFREPVSAFSPLLARDDSWEISSIDRLGNIPQILKDYLRFAPELRKYAAYYDRCTAARAQ